MKHIEEYTRSTPWTGRIVRARSGAILFLLADGSTRRVDNNLLAAILGNFRFIQEAFQYGEFESIGTWYTEKNRDIKKYPGQTLAVVYGSGQESCLIIYDDSLFFSLIRKFEPNDMITVEQYAKAKGKSLGHVRKYCSKGLLIGANKVNGRWFIPSDAEWPGDGRCCNRRQEKKEK